MAFFGPLNLFKSDCSWFLMASTRFDLEKFNNENDFYLSSLNMREILIQLGLDNALDDDENPIGKNEKGEG